MYYTTTHVWWRGIRHRLTTGHTTRVVREGTSSSRACDGPLIVKTQVIREHLGERIASHA